MNYACHAHAHVSVCPRLLGHQCHLAVIERRRCCSAAIVKVVVARCIIQTHKTIVRQITVLLFYCSLLPAHLTDQGSEEGRDRRVGSQAMSTMPFLRIGGGIPILCANVDGNSRRQMNQKEGRKEFPVIFSASGEVWV